MLINNFVSKKGEKKMGVKGTNWIEKRNQEKKAYLDNLDKMLKLYSPELAEDLDVDGSFEGQVRALKALTELGDFLKAMNAQMDSLEFHLFNLERKTNQILEQNKKILEVSK